MERGGGVETPNRIDRSRSEVTSLEQITGQLHPDGVQIQPKQFEPRMQVRDQALRGRVYEEGKVRYGKVSLILLSIPSRQAKHRQRW